MYNYQIFVRDSRLHKKFDEIRKNYLDTNQSRQKKMPSMIQAHKKRIEGFIISMVQKPISVQQYRNKMFEHRSFDKKKNLAHNAFYTNHHLSKTRIEEISQQNSVLDEIPFENVSKHKFRNFQWTPDTKPLRYTPVTSALRVKEKLEYQPLNQVCSFRNKNIEQSLKTCYKTGNTRGLMKIANKSLLPNLHQKTHFHSIKTIYSESPCGFLKKNSQEKENQDRNTYEQQNQFQNKKQQEKIQNDFMNRKENSRQALVRCGLLKNINQNKKMYATTGSLSHKN